MQQAVSEINGCGYDGFPVECPECGPPKAQKISITTGVSVIPPGARVKVGGMVMRVLQVSICNGFAISYKVCYWKDDERQDLWVEDFEVTLIDVSEEPVEIGFHVVKQQAARNPGG